MLLICALIVALTTVLIPRFVRYLPLRKHQAPAFLPLMAGIVFFGAFLVPDIHITDETQTFQQHFIGGGIYTALLYSYFKLLLGWKTHWTIDLLLLFAWTSAFGVASELAEFTLLKLHLTNINIEDTGWDLLANSSGAFLSYLIIKKSVSFPQS